MKQNNHYLNYYPSQNPILKLKQEMKLRNFSGKTIHSYLYYITDILKKANKNPKTTNSNDIRNYLETMVNNQKSSSTINVAYNAFKFYFEKILRRKFFINIPRAKKSKYLPNVLSKQEIKKMINAVDNPKHKFLIKFLYSTGLRISESVKIKMQDIDIDRKLVFVKAGKGNKDRYTLLADSLIKILQE